MDTVFDLNISAVFLLQMLLRSLRPSGTILRECKETYQQYSRPTVQLLGSSCGSSSPIRA